MRISNVLENIIKVIFDTDLDLKQKLNAGQPGQHREFGNDPTIFHRGVAISVK